MTHAKLVLLALIGLAAACAPVQPEQPAAFSVTAENMVEGELPLTPRTSALKAGDMPTAAEGETIFRHKCATCHGKGPGIDGSPMLPGSANLAARYQGDVSPFLEDRDDLTFETLQHFVRNGSGAMPMFRPAELTDRDVAAIAAYLAKSSSASTAP